jgi:hypothetical protein
MRYRLRTLLIVLAIGPIVLGIAGREAWRRYDKWQRARLIQGVLNGIPAPAGGGIRQLIVDREPQPEYTPISKVPVGPQD